MVRRNGKAPRVVHLQGHLVTHGEAPARDGADVGNVAAEGQHLLHVVHRRADLEHARVVDLATRFGVERGCVEDDADRLVASDVSADGGDELTAHLVQDGGNGGLSGLPDVLDVVVGQRDTVGLKLVEGEGVEECLGGGDAAASNLVRLHFVLEALHVDRHALLLRKEAREIDGKAVSVVQDERVDAADDLPARLGVVEVLQPDLPGACERLLLVGQDGLDALDGLGVLQVGEERTEGGDDNVHELREESSLGAEELAAVADGATNNTTENEAAANGVGNGAVGEGNGQAADVIGNDAVRDGDVILVLERVVRSGELRHLLDRGEDGAPCVGVVVRRDVLEDRGDALEAHAGVDVGLGEGDKLATDHALKLHEHQVPDLEHHRVVLVDKVGGVAPPEAVEVDLGARAARAGLPNLPEVVLHVPLQDVVVGDELAPDITGLVVARDVVLRVALEVRDVQAVLGQLVHDSQQLPGPHDRLALEVVAEGPRAEHLKERVVVGVTAHVLKVVVLAAGTNAHLRVRGTRQAAEVGAGVSGSEEQALELVHPRVDEQERGVVVGDYGGAHHEGVRVLLHEEVDELLSDAGNGPRKSRHCFELRR